jgi:LacI family transcriptional regulator, repressor for deo operon, udp, cdd, tsx, nupC, and nupG
MRVCERRGIVVPSQMAIVGFEDSIAARESSLTTVTVDKDRLGETAVELLLNTDITPRNVLEPVRLVERESTLGRESYLRMGTEYSSS